MSPHGGNIKSLYVFCIRYSVFEWHQIPSRFLLMIETSHSLPYIPLDSHWISKIPLLRFPCNPTNDPTKKKVKAASSTAKVHYLLSLCLLWTLATIGSCDAGGLPQYVATHTRTSSLKEDWQLKPAGLTVPLSAAQSDEPQKNSIRKAWKGMSRQGRFKSPLNPKWVVLSLWVTVQSPGIRTEILRRAGSPDATFTVAGPIHPQN